jgi:predicted ArsR family transcriptional regulator
MSAIEAIANPTRLRLVRHLAKHETASLAELAAAASVHPNTARPHLAALEEAGVVTRSADDRAERGRPPVRYRLAGDWTLDPAGPLGLSGLLASVVLRSGLSSKELRALGAEWGRYLVGRPGAGAPGREIPLSLGALGYDARLTNGTVELSACPCPVVLPSHPDRICRLADGVIDGVLAASGGELEAGKAEHDPERRHCTVRVERSRRRSPRRVPST